MSARDSTFSPSAVILLAAAGTALFALSVLLAAYGDPGASSGDRTGPGTYSNSALGCSGLYETLRRLGLPARRGLGNVLAMAGQDGTVVLAEPEMIRIAGSDEAKKLLFAPRLLLVLPKWNGFDQDARPGWISRAEPAPSGMARAVLGWVAGPGSVVRRAWPERWETNGLGVRPADMGVVQLIRMQGIRPVVADGDEVLVGEIQKDGRSIWILSDPDILANHGIGKGDNLPFALALLDAAARSGGGNPEAPLVFDETVHGFQERQGSPAQLLFRFPFVVATVLACLAACLWLAAGAGRFGPARRPRPPLDFGKATLIGNSARLLDYAGHRAATLRRYADMAVRSAAQALHAPGRLEGAELAAWLDRIGKARGAKHSCETILRTMGAPRPEKAENLPLLFQCVRDLHIWKGEIVNGSGTNRRNGQ